MEKAREFQKNIYFCFLDYAKAYESLSFPYGTEFWEDHPFSKNSYKVIRTVARTTVARVSAA